MIFELCRLGIQIISKNRFGEYLVVFEDPQCDVISKNEILVFIEFCIVFDLGKKFLVIFEQFFKIDCHELVNWKIGLLMLESPVEKQKLSA